MDKLIESLLNINIRKNEGYIFVKQEDICAYNKNSIINY